MDTKWFNGCLMAAGTVRRNSHWTMFTEQCSANLWLEITLFKLKTRTQIWKLYVGCAPKWFLLLEFVVYDCAQSVCLRLFFAQLCGDNSPALHRAIERRCSVSLFWSVASPPLRKAGIAFIARIIGKIVCLTSICLCASSVTGGDVPWSDDAQTNFQRKRQIFSKGFSERSFQASLHCYVCSHDRLRVIVSE